MATVYFCSVNTDSKRLGQIKKDTQEALDNGYILPEETKNYQSDSIDITSDQISLLKEYGIQFQISYTVFTTLEFYSIISEMIYTIFDQPKQSIQLYYDCRDNVDNDDEPKHILYKLLNIQKIILSMKNSDLIITHNY